MTDLTQRCLCFAISCVGILMLSAPLQTAAETRAGAGKASITPPVETVPTQLGGYGDRDGKPATGVHDPAMV